jgi:hypothetical protein
MQILSINLGFSYVPKTIRARIDSSELIVDEVDPNTGRIAIHVSQDLTGELSIDYQRRIFQAGGPRQTKILGSASACIYCGSTSSLTDEHIIPLALEGEFVIRSASCDACAQKTSRFERKVLRDALLAPRTALKLRTRRPRERPTSLPLVHKVGGVEKLVDVPVADHPTYLALPLFALPAHVRRDNIPNLKVVAPGAHVVSVAAATLEAAARRVGQGDIAVRASLDIYAFARLLAKIAHGFLAVADLSDVEAFLPGAMFASDESIGKWVGGAPDVKISAEGLHGVHLELVEGEIHVRVRLFAQLGGPEYMVIAGRLIEPPSGIRPISTIESLSIGSQ